MSTVIARVAGAGNVRVWYDSAVARTLVLVAVCTAAACYGAARLVALGDADVWWHLRTGLWIQPNHAVPRTGIFSQSATLPWVDSSWAFDLLAGASFRVLGLRALPVLLLVLQVAVAAALFLLARAAGRNFWPALILVVIGQFALGPQTLRPSLFSMLFLALELTLLLHVSFWGQAARLFWLVPLFAVWANLDRQFTYGLLALALLVVASVTESVFRQMGSRSSARPRSGISPGITAAAFGTCLLATFLNPYTYRLHQLLWQSALSSAADRYFHELHAMRFRQPPDFVLLLLTMMAFFALGRRRSRDLFQISLLVIAAIVSFRFQRDTWLVGVVAVAVIGNALAEISDNDAARTNFPGRLKILATAALVLLVVLIACWRIPDSAALFTEVSKKFPVRASDYVRQNQLPQPLFNSYAWGGFLTWYLPAYPTVIDGRADLYGDANNIPFFKVMQAEIPLESYPEFASSQTILLEASSPIAQALGTIAGFRVAYRDEQAIVLVRAE